MSPPVIVFSTTWFGVRILPEGKKQRWQTKHVHWEAGQLVWGAPELSSYSLIYRVATEVHNEKTTSIGWVSKSQSQPGWFSGQFFPRKLVFISYCKKCQLKLWYGIRAKVAALLLCVNCQLLQHQSFCFFGLSFIIQQQCWWLYAPEGLMMDQKIWALLANVLFCFWIYQSHYAVLIRFGWCVLIALRWLVVLALCFWSYLSWRHKVSMQMEGS